MKEREGPTYITARTRIAICILTVTKIRISELLSLKVGQLETLLVKDRKRDFEFLFLMIEMD